MFPKTLLGSKIAFSITGLLAIILASISTFATPGLPLRIPSTSLMTRLGSALRTVCPFEEICFDETKIKRVMNRKFENVFIYVIYF